MSEIMAFSKRLKLRHDWMPVHMFVGDEMSDHKHLFYLSKIGIMRPSGWAVKLDKCQARGEVQIVNSKGK